MFLFSSTFFNLWNTFRIALLTSSSASPIIISGSVSIDWLFMLAVGCFFSGFVFLFPMRQSVVFWRYCLLPHVLGGFSSLARGNRSFLAYVSSGDCSTYFFSVFFSTALVLFRTHEHTSTSQILPIPETLPLSAVSSALLRPPWTQTIASFTRQDHWFLFEFPISGLGPGNFLQKEELTGFTLFLSLFQDCCPVLSVYNVLRTLMSYILSSFVVA